MNKLMEIMQSHWRQMKPREKRMLLAAVAVVLTALVWWLALAPAIKTLRLAPAQHRSLDAQIQGMQSLSLEAKALQNQPKIGFEDAQKALQASVTQRFGNAAQLNIAGERATLTLKNASPQDLAQWLTQARVNARVLPSEVKLTRSTVAPNPSSSVGGAGWDGSMVLNMPKK